jgi:hypothetical protein
MDSSNDMRLADWRCRKLFRPATGPHASLEVVDLFLDLVSPFERPLDLRFGLRVLGGVHSVGIIVFELLELLFPAVRHLPCRRQGR